MEINVNSTVWMTRLALPGMVSRRRGAIVNFASAAALNPTPLLAGYSGAKGFIVVRYTSEAGSERSFLVVFEMTFWKRKEVAAFFQILWLPSCR